MKLDRLSGVVYLILLVVLAITGARVAASNYFVADSARSNSFEETDAAIRIQPENPRPHEVRGLELMQRGEFASAADSFARAVSLSPNDYRLWLELGKVRLLDGEVDEAEIAYTRAIELAPGYSLPQMELGRMYLGLGQRDKAFQFLGSAARLEQSHYAEVLKSANVAFGDDPNAIERAVAPGSRKGKSIVAWYFLDRGWMTDKSRAFLLSDEPTLDEKNTVIRFLKEKRNYQFAREVWLSRLATDGVSTDALAAILDGGFELVAESDPSGFGWQLDHEISSISISKDDKDVHSGSGALKIRFAGNAELQRPVVSQIVPVDPGKRYTLTFFFRAGKMVSAGLPAILVTNPATNVIYGRSDPIEDSKGVWIRRSVSFTAPNESAVLISLQRPDCKSQPCPIFGEVSIDDFSFGPNEP